MTICQVDSWYFLPDGIQLRILQICSSGSPGGGPAHVKGLSHELLVLGHEVHVACRPKSYLSDWLEKTDVSTHIVPLRNAIGPQSLRVLNRIVRQNDIQLVHAHSGRDFPFCYFLKVLNPSIKYVLTRHTAKLNRANLFTRRVFANAARIIAVSEGIRQRMVDAFGLNGEHVQTIPNWVDLKKYEQLPSAGLARVKFNIKTPYVVAVIGRLVPTKGQEEFIRAAVRIMEKRDDVTFLVVGVNEYADNKAYVRLLRDLISINHCDDAIRLLPWQADLGELFSVLTVIAAPSWFDAFNIVIVEAMSAGVAVVAADIAGPSEIIEHNKTGLLAPPKNVEHLASAIEHLLGNRELRQQLEKAAKLEINAKYGKDRVIAQIERVYEDAIT